MRKRPDQGSQRKSGEKSGPGRRMSTGRASTPRGVARTAVRSYLGGAATIPTRGRRGGSGSASPDVADRRCAGAPGVARGEPAHARRRPDRRPRPQPRAAAATLPGRRDSRARRYAEQTGRRSRRPGARPRGTAGRMGTRRSQPLAGSRPSGASGARDLTGHATVAGRRRRPPHHYARDGPSAAAALGTPRRSAGGRPARVARELGRRRRRRSADAGSEQGRAAHRAVLRPRAGRGAGRAVRAARAHARGSALEGETSGPVRTVGVAWDDGWPRSPTWSSCSTRRRW